MSEYGDKDLTTLRLERQAAKSQRDAFLDAAALAAFPVMLGFAPRHACAEDAADRAADLACAAAAALREARANQSAALDAGLADLEDALVSMPNAWAAPEREPPTHEEIAEFIRAADPGVADALIALRLALHEGGAEPEIVVTETGSTFGVDGEVFTPPRQYTLRWQRGGRWSDSQVRL